MPGKNLTRDEARERARLIEVASYDIALDLTTGPTTFRSETVIRFTCDRPGAATFADLLAPEVHEVRLNDRVLDPAKVYDGTRIQLDGLAAENELRVVASCAYSRTGQGLHRFEDPADRGVYTYTHFEPADARRLYANFEQPDLKASFTFSVIAPEEWTVVSNAPESGREPVAPGVARWRFEPTKRISTYITAIAAGTYHVLRDVYEGDGVTIPLGLLCRASLAEHFDADRLFDQTKRGFAFFHRDDRFGLVYPFGKYDQVFVPEYNIGAMENPGCVTFRDEAYVFRSKVTEAAYEGRANTLLHEMAHMWFGDLVTMRWWDDLWLKESFADYMGTAAVAEATEYPDSWVSFAIRRKAWAYRQDQLPTTHPIVADIRDLEDAMLNFDGITYAKGASVLKQLVAYVGKEHFYAGARRYFAQHAYGNTSLDDLLSALEAESGRDLSTWSKAWLETTGMNRLVPEVAVDDAGNVTGFTVVQQGEPLRPHRIAIGAYEDDGSGALVRTRRVEVDVTGARTDVAEFAGAPRPALLLLNDDDLTYCKIAFDDVSAATLRDRLSDVADPLARALCWSAMWNLARDAELPAREFVDLVLRHAAREPRIAVVQMVLEQAESALELYADPAWRETGTTALAEHALAELRAAAPGGDHQLAWARCFGHTAASDAHLALLRGLVDGTEAVPGLDVDKELVWLFTETLVAAGAADGGDVDAALARDDTAAGRQHAASCRAAAPREDAKANAWAAVVESDALPNAMVDATIHGFARLSQAELLTPYTERYFAALTDVWANRSIEIARRIVVGLYPMWDLSHELLRRTDDWLADDTRPPALRRLVLERRDDAQRALNARARDAR
ncbi:aminopeptidase N [Yinghuangia seranimata]|uniref:aminopeptidase N n=1 Tax=Yinghuangia seranimata TaxID=408067 RepID=UPI00248B2EE1|nr:aminopeptidase N [Yinghuangia seranimata]MDI2127350.1 aminopeptidase N [Yinghuangia seranimata]